jgi:hypothetical protein
MALDGCADRVEWKRKPFYARQSSHPFGGSRLGVYGA